MLPTLQRTYSKAKANGNHVVWTSQESIPVTFALDGLLSCGTYGLYTASGRPAYCSGFQVSFTAPGQDPAMYVQVSLLDRFNQLVPGSLLKLYGTTPGQFQTVVPAFFLNVGDTLQFNVAILNGVDQYLPQDTTLTYFLNYANGLLGQQGFYIGIGGGGSASDNVFAANYGGAAPPFNPNVPAAIATDTSTGRQWSWWGAAWH